MDERDGNTDDEPWTDLRNISEDKFTTLGDSERDVEK